MDPKTCTGTALRGTARTAAKRRTKGTTMTTIRDDDHIILDGVREDGTPFTVDLTELHQTAIEALTEGAHYSPTHRTAALTDGLLDIASALAHAIGE
jgi:hypothetical protein